MFFTEKNRKKNLIVFSLVLPLFCGVVFLAQTLVVHAGMFSSLGDGIGLVFKGLFYSIFKLFGLLASVAVGIFEWAINPNNVALLFNRPSIYETWKFIRDFFNLLFILVLLYTAFKIIFQIEHNFKKTLLSIVLAALYINFSYPVTRVLIDVTNVPMYFFANQMMASDGKTTMFSSTMTASKLEKILLPKDLIDTDFTNIIAAIVFIFIFSITLLVLSIMFMIRLIVLVVLVIFSSVGFAASIAPGLEQYSKQWWENFWRYAFFGPIAMLMLVVATRFFASISDNNSDLALSMKATAGTTAAGNGAAEYLAPMMMFSIPIIMLWIAMGLAQKMSIAGAGSVVGMGQSFSKWAGKKTYNNPVGRGLYGGGKKVVMEGKVAGLNYGKFPGGKFLTGDYWASPSKTEATIKGGIAGGWGGGAKARKKLDQQAVIDRVKKDKENQVSNSTHHDNLKNSKNPIEREAAALALANDKEIRTAEELSQAMDVLKNNTDGLIKVIDNAKSGAVKSMDSASYATARELHYEKDNTGAVRIDPGTGKPMVREGMEKSLDALDDRVGKEGNIKVVVDYEVSKGVPLAVAVGNALKDLESAKGVANSGSLFDDPRYAADAIAYVHAKGPDYVTQVKKSSAEAGTTVGSRL